MKKNILIIISHPKQTSLNYHIFNIYINFLKKQNHNIKTIELYKENFNPITHLSREESNDKQIIKYQELLKWADHITLIFPVWWFNYPAMLKGFFDKVLTAKFAFRYNKFGLPIPLLKSKTTTIIRSFGSPSYVKFFFGNGNLRGLSWGTLRFCGIKTKHIFDLHGVNTKSFNEKKLNRFLKKLETSVKKL